MWLAFAVSLPCTISQMASAVLPYATRFSAYPWLWRLWSVEHPPLAVSESSPTDCVVPVEVGKFFAYLQSLFRIKASLAWKRLDSRARNEAAHGSFVDVLFHSGLAGLALKAKSGDGVKKDTVVFA